MSLIVGAAGSAVGASAGSSGAVSVVYGFVMLVAVRAPRDGLVDIARLELVELLESLELRELALRVILASLHAFRMPQRDPSGRGSAFGVKFLHDTGIGLGCCHDTCELGGCNATFA